MELSKLLHKNASKSVSLVKQTPQYINYIQCFCLKMEVMYKSLQLYGM